MRTVVSVKTMRQSDAATIARGVSSKDLMARAGRGIFESYAWRGRVCIVCGVGNNAGDGYVLALCLRQAGIMCDLLLTEHRFSPDGAYYFEQCRANGIPVITYSSDVFYNGYLHKCSYIPDFFHI